MAKDRSELATHYYSIEEYFGLEEASDARFEYWDGDVVCMSGGTRWHGTISGNVYASLALAARGGPCRAFTADTAIWTPTLPPYRYPDASVGCGELQFKRVRSLDALVNPVLIVEVLSPSTETQDREAKFAAYQALPSFREYLLIAQDEVRLTHYTRQTGGVWLRQDRADLGGSLSLSSIACVLHLKDVYDGVVF